MSATLSVGGMLKKLTSLGLHREIKPSTPVIVMIEGMEFPVSHFELDREGRLVLWGIGAAQFGDS